MDSHAGYWIGIDLGTYNSSAAIQSKQGEIEIIKSIGGKVPGKTQTPGQHEDCKEFPSFISFNKENQQLCFGSLRSDDYL